MGDSEESGGNEEAREEKAVAEETTGDEAGEEHEGEELSDEELRRHIEEAMEKITVADVVLDLMVSLSSLAYQRMGIPHEVNEKFRDLEQARMAIDCLDALVKTLEGRVPPEALDPLSSTVTNLKMNYAKEA